MTHAFSTCFHLSSLKSWSLPASMLAPSAPYCTPFPPPSQLPVQDSPSSWGHLFIKPGGSMEKSPHCASQAVLFIPCKMSGTSPDFLLCQLPRWSPRKSPEPSTRGQSHVFLKGQSHGESLKQGSVPPEPPEGLRHRLSAHWPQMVQTYLPGNPHGLTVKRPVGLMLATLLHLPACLSVTISCSLNIYGGRGDSEQGPPALPAAAVQSTLPSLTI